MKLGGGVLDLSVSNSYTGGTTISGGSLELGNANAAQGSTVTNNVASGLIFSTNGTTYNLAGLAGSGNISLLGVSGGSVALSIGAGGATSVYSGVLSGSGADRGRWQGGAQRREYLHRRDKDYGGRTATRQWRQYRHAVQRQPDRLDRRHAGFR